VGHMSYYFNSLFLLQKKKQFVLIPVLSGILILILLPYSTSYIFCLFII